MPENVVVVGSLNLDMVVRVPRRPQKGETLRGTGFDTFAGGKGNNQALAAARAGAKVAMVGRVGQDMFGDTMLAMLARNGVDHTYVFRDPEAGTGIATIMVDAEGDNSIVLTPQANDRLSPLDVEQARPAIETAQVLLLQLEVPVENNIAAARLARMAGALVILNPAPAPESGSLPQELLQEVDLLIPNQTEAQLLTGISVTSEASARVATQALRSLGPDKVIITLGEQGALLVDGEQEPQLIPAFPVKAIDTTAAGDAFCGALAAKLARGASLAEAVRFGCAAGALAATRLGAEPSLPYEQEIVKLVSSS